MFKNFLSLTKPGIIFGNLITVTAGFFLASRTNINYILFLITLLSVALVIASGCVFNNYIDRDIDKLMQRTKNRVLARGLIHPMVALAYGVILGLVGLMILYVGANKIAFFTAIVGLIIYVVIYSLWLKRSSVYATIIGSFSGAIPPVVGYCVVTNKLDLGAMLLFLILSLWQMPHSFAIAIYRLDDYKRANIPILPIAQGILATKINILVYTACYVIASLSLFWFNYTGVVYCIAALLSGVFWIRLAIKGFNSTDTTNTRAWAYKIFMCSVICLTILSITMALDVIT